ncbi:MAG: hypothetical protein ACE5IR_20355 [bacterium]
MHENTQEPTVEDLIETLHAMREVCSQYEKKYNMLTEQFFELYSQGLLDDDGPNVDFADWAGSYKTALQCQQLYNDYFKDTTVDEKLTRIKSHALVA